MSIRIIILSILILAGFEQVLGQLSINAGSDKILCMCADTLYIGGNPTAKGENIPFKYKWELLPYKYKGHQLLASSFRSDTCSANPFFKCNAFLNDTVYFILTVTDSKLNTKQDTVKVIISSIAFVYEGAYMPTINQGDSVKLNTGNVFNGIAPFSYHWEPSIGLSAPNIERPYAKPDSTTSYTCHVIDALGCRSRDRNVILVIPTKVGLQGLPLSQSYIYPNPILDDSRLQIENQFHKELVIQIIDSNGRIILIDYFNTETIEIGNKIKTNGIFTYVIKHKNEVISYGKIIK